MSTLISGFEQKSNLIYQINRTSPSNPARLRRSLEPHARLSRGIGKNKKKPAKVVTKVEKIEVVSHDYEEIKHNLKILENYISLPK